MQNKSQIVGRPVSGSKPRKHITKINLNNPSLISNSVTALFKHPVALQQYNGSKPSLIKFADSLSKAEQQYSLYKQPRNAGLIVQPQRQPVPSSSPNRILQRRFSTPSMPSYGSFSSNGSNNVNYNFVDHQSIKAKQNHGFNIINCIPAGYKQAGDLNN